MGAAGDVIVYRSSPYDEIRVRNLATGSEATLQNATTFPSFRSSMTSEWIYGQYVNRPVSGCVPDCVLRWPITGGQPTPLPRSDTSPGPIEIIAVGTYAVWINDAGQTTIALHNATTGTTRDVVVTGTADTQVLKFDLAVVDGEPVIYYWAGPPGAVGRPIRTVRLYRWSEARGSEQVEVFEDTNAPGGAQPIFATYISADTDHVAYTVWTPATGGSPASISTVVRPTRGGATQKVGGRSHDPRIRGGVLMWEENSPAFGGGGSPDSGDIFAWSAARGTEELQLPDRNVGGGAPAPGFAVFSSRPSSGTSTMLHSWNAATAEKVKLTESTVIGLYATTGWAYFYGDNLTYRVKLQ